jgi:2-oxo-4-hydroxy-4-carboxy-5-ureidoimidazoline decarboxylase
MSGPHEVLNEATEEAAGTMLARCCGAHRWVEGMLQRRPFASAAALQSAARETWEALSPTDWREAFGHHPRIGASEGETLPEPVSSRFEAPPPKRWRSQDGVAGTADWSREEQAGMQSADAGTRAALRDANVAYERRFGFVFLVCATGKSARAMLDALASRLGNDPEIELRVAAGEQAKITGLRLEKLAR